MALGNRQGAGKGGERVTSTLVNSLVVRVGGEASALCSERGACIRTVEVVASTLANSLGVGTVERSIGVGQQPRRGKGWKQYLVLVEVVASTLVNCRGPQLGRGVEWRRRWAAGYARQRVEKSVA